MAVFRVERTQNYTVMSNYHLRDKTISFKAKGLLSLMLSLPEDWDYTLAGLTRISLEGKDAIRAAVVELMVEAVCSKKKNIRVAGNDFPQAVVKSRLLKLDGEHIRFVFDCLRENTTQVRNMKQYLLTVLYNAPATIENHYAAQVNYDLYGGEAA